MKPPNVPQQNWIQLGTTIYALLPTLSKALWLRTSSSWLSITLWNLLFSSKFSFLHSWKFSHQTTRVTKQFINKHKVTQLMQEYLIPYVFLALWMVELVAIRLRPNLYRLELSVMYRARPFSSVTANSWLKCQQKYSPIWIVALYKFL